MTLYSTFVNILSYSLIHYTGSRMQMAKKRKTYYISKEHIDSIARLATQQERSDSFILDKLLDEIFKKKLPS